MEVAVPDYVVCVIGLSISLGVGVFYAYKDRNKLSLFRYHRGDAKLKALPVAISLLVTEESSIFFLGYPAEIYAYGIPYMFTSIAKSVGFISVVYVAIPLFYPMGITSVHEYLEKRYDSTLIARMTGVIGVLGMALYSAIVLIGTSVALSAVTSIDVWIFVIGLAAVAVIYTALGGMKAVVFADVIQCCTMMLSVVAVLVYGTICVGGIGKVVRLNMPTGRMKMFDFDPNPIVRNSFWAIMIGQLGGTFTQELCTQSVVQRFSSTKSVKEARKVMFIYIPCLCIIELLVMCQGLVAFAYFSIKGCDPLASGQITNPNQIIPFTVADMVSDIPGAVGLYFAALCSASLSTISSMFSCMSAVATVELQKTVFKSSSQRKITIFSKILVIILASVCVIFALIIEHAKGPLTQIVSTILASASAPVAGIFALAIFSRRSSVKGIIAGAAFGLAFGSWIAIGSNLSSGTKPSQSLPSGPTFKCIVSQINMADQAFSGWNATYKTAKHSGNITVQSMNTTNESTAVSTMQVTVQQGVTGIDRLYSISFHYFSILVTLVTISSGLIVSRVFKGHNQSEIPEYLTMSMSAVLRSCLCPFLKSNTTGTFGNNTTEEHGLPEHDGSYRSPEI